MPYKNKDKQREYQSSWINARRARFFFDKECFRCGGKDNLELHHRDPTKKESHRIWSWSEEKRKVEIAKCDVLCHKCHVKAHTKTPTHGTLNRYKHWKCRCALCRRANAASIRKYRSSKKA